MQTHNRYLLAARWSLRVFEASGIFRWVAVERLRGSRAHTASGEVSSVSTKSVVCPPTMSFASQSLRLVSTLHRKNRQYERSPQLLLQLPLHCNELCSELDPIT